MGFVDAWWQHPFPLWTESLIIIALHIQQQDSLEKLSDIVQQVSLHLTELCNCALTTEYIANGRLVCNSEQLQKVILQGRIVSTTKINSTDLLMMLQGWVLANKPTVVVQGVQLKVDPECSVELENLGDIECRAHAVDSMVGSSFPIPAVGGAVGGVLVFIVIVVILVGVFICAKKKKRKGTNNTPSVRAEGVK